MRAALWPSSSAAEHAQELMPFLEGTTSYPFPLENFIAEASGQLVGFLEVDLRSHADGCDPFHPVGYIEGWYVDPGWRGKGIGGKLLAAAEDWARGHGCREMASDALIDNELSQRVHEAAGYEVVDRCVHYRRSL
jgi:aminoglycoside 6'-N-acetyltransferase I